jgi:uncharacterized protein (DUF1499 family)
MSARKHHIERRLALAMLLLATAGCAAHGGRDLTLTTEDRLQPCPASPNCVCSDDADPGHQIPPLAIQGDPAAAWSALIDQLQTAPSYTIVEQNDGYLRAEARTRILRFVDDVEFHLRPDQGEIAMRSASRVGYSDLGTNRRRLETLRQALAERGVVAP